MLYGGYPSLFSSLNFSFLGLLRCFDSSFSPLTDGCLSLSLNFFGFAFSLLHTGYSDLSLHLPGQLSFYCFVISLFPGISLSLFPDRGLVFSLFLGIYLSLFPGSDCGCPGFL